MKGYSKEPSIKFSEQALRLSIQEVDTENIKIALHANRLHKEKEERSKSKTWDLIFDYREWTSFEEKADVQDHKILPM